MPVLAKLRGAPGTSVRLKLADKEVTVVRELIRLPGARLKVQVVDGGRVGRGGRHLVGARLREGQAGVAEGPSPTEFQLEAGEHPRIAFTSDGAGKITGAILNPGPQQVSGTKVD